MVVLLSQSFEEGQCTHQFISLLNFSFAVYHLRKEDIVVGTVQFNFALIIFTDATEFISITVICNFLNDSYVALTVVT